MGVIPGEQPAAAKPAASITQFLAGGMLAFTGALTALGVGEGAIERIMRNEPWPFFLCFLLVVFSIGLGVILPAVSDRVPDILLVPGAIVLLGALVWMGQLAVASANTQERPNVDASLTTTPEGKLLVEGTVSVSGLKSNQYVLTRVEGHSTDPLAQHHLGGLRQDEDEDDVLPAAEDGPAGPYQVVYAARSGPAVDGTVSAPVKVELPAGVYDSVVVSALTEHPGANPVANRRIRRCSRETEFWGCVQILAPDPPGVEPGG